jgi:cytochrome c biogenesis protein CcmG, thiol:disulfide interchange protein DsbE
MGSIGVCHPSAVARVLVAILAALALAGCGQDDPPPYKGDPDALKGSPPPLAKLHRQANDLLGGGEDAFKARLEQLKGYPVVVNKWASWCGPCRAEFPFFQKHSIRLGKRVAFLGVDSNDNDGDARDFLAKYPVSYPTYKDPSVKVAELFDAQIAWPSTAYYDRKGELAYVKQGGYLHEEDLVADLKRYAK